jgi:hypothetical protein
VTYLGHFSPLFPITFTIMYALECFLVGVSTSFSGHVFLDTSLGYDIPTFAHSSTPIPLTSFFNYVHTLGTMYDSSLGV